MRLEKEKPVLEAFWSWIDWQKPVRNTRMDKAMSRKNWLFSSSVDGANASAVVYTMVEMAKAHGVNIDGYLKFLLEHRPNKDVTDEQFADMAPWSGKERAWIGANIHRVLSESM